MGLIGRVWAEIGGDASGLKKALAGAKSDLEKFGNTATSAGKASGLSLASVASAMAIVTAAVVATKKVFEFGKEGAQIASLVGASHKLAYAYDTSMTDIVESVKKASFNTITEYDAMKASNLALTMGISTNAEEIGNLMEISIMRGRAFGLSAEEAFDRITRGIGRRSTKILDDLGFTADAISANKAYADSIGISTAALTNEDRVRALFNQLLEQGNIELEKQGGLTMDVSTAYQRLGAVYKDTWNEMATGVGYALLPLFTSKEEEISIAKQRAEIGMLAEDYKAYVRGRRDMVIAGGLRGDFVDILTEEQFAIEVGMKKRQRAFGVYQQEAGIIELVATEREAEVEGMLLKHAVTSDGISINEQYNEKMGELATQEQEFQGILDEGTRKSWNIRGKTMREAAEALDKVRDAQGKLTVQYKQQLGISAFDLVTSGMEGANPRALMDVANAMGIVDDKTYGLESAFYDVVDGLDGFTDGVVEADMSLAGNIERVGAATDIYRELSASTPEGWTVDSYYNIFQTTYIRTVYGSGPVQSLGNRPQPEGVRTQYLGLGKMHGGVVYGGQHGMIVPPGFGNDGMPVMVSSGERMNVTPAGNKTIDNVDLLAEMKGLRDDIQSLPIYFRDAVQML